MYLTLNSKQALVDVLLDGEYFASLCDFKYPISSLSEDGGSGEMKLISDVHTNIKDKRIISGLMVWHNKAYVPVIRFKNDAQHIAIGIKNESELPYPVIKKTKAWLDAFYYYLTNKSDCEDFDELEKESIYKYRKEIHKILY